MASFEHLPDELLVDHLLPNLPVRDVLALSATNPYYANLCNDETFWKRKCKEDFNFQGSRTARTKGWKFIYKGLSNPKVFVWGCNANGRLGAVGSFAGHSRNGVPYPKQLSFPKNSAIVDLIAGGWSFHALDSSGRVYVWGTMDGEMFGLQSDGFSLPEKVAETPLRLELPEPIRTLSCGRKHSMAMDAKNQIWTFISWGRPFRLITPALDCTSPDSTPIQAECGWGYSAALASSGDIYIWWPLGESIQQQFGATMGQMDAEGDKRAQATAEGTIPCVTWDLHYNPQKLPAVPHLPELSHTGRVMEKDEEEDTKVVKIAGMDGFLIALTNKGHVLKFGGLSNETFVHQAQWEYLPNFSETEKIRAHPAFAGGERREEGKPDTLAPPVDVQITHITAHFDHFVAYTHEDNSIVLQGNTDTRADEAAHVIPELQYKAIISVGLGDYHSVALSADGKLYSWGAFQMGALGLGQPEELPVGAPGGYTTQQQIDRARQGYRVHVPDVPVPTEVRFDHDLKKRRDRFCFAATAAGWHSGALVIDLDPEVRLLQGSRNV
ncbi:RCC1/BLIP-II [Fomitiporia mediterranea MF3/22]|uniref:RCC1/BLIP-II n=1 Tax=Fomitiporia mediterranea (strain MF3/22) TaxID=694068 RepID=UPI0004409AE5|nr:RCC1/BLIP-II [Fomitiporia mediterranea MF3/22]EJD07301.1 RCC1/BLIP-II [Fomitiporia mediterranea MF3/22]